MMKIAFDIQRFVTKLTNGDDEFGNYTVKNVVYGYGGNDSIYNAGDNSKIYGGAGNDSLNNAASESFVYGDAGNDTVTNSGEKSKIYGGAGNDSLNNAASESFVYGDAGNDTVSNTGANSKIYGGAGDDLITNAASNSTVYGEAGNDTLYNTGVNSKVYGGAGNDSITNNASNSTVYGDAGNDYISGTYNSTIYGAAGNDTLSVGKNGYVDGGAGNDSILGNDGVTILGGAGNDELIAGTNAYADGGAGNDAITIGSGDVNPGKGNDTVSVTGSSGYLTYYYANGEGNDVVYGAGGIPNRYVSLSSSTYYQTIKSGSDLIVRTYNKNVNTSGGSITFKDTASVQIVGFPGGYAASATVSTPSGGYNYSTKYADLLNVSAQNVVYRTLGGDDNITINGNSASINAGAGADYIVNSGNYSTILGDAGNDTVYSSSGKQTNYFNMGAGNDSVFAANEASSTVDGGAGNDTLDGIFSGSTVDGGAGNDQIFGTYSTSSITGNAGNDTISLSGSTGSINTIAGGKGNDKIYVENASNPIIYEYSYGDGKDTVFGAKSTDTLHISTGNYNTTLNKDGDLVVNIGMNTNFNGSITFKGISTIASIDGVYLTTNKASNTVFSGTTDKDYLYNAGKNVTIQGNSGDDSIGNYGANSKVYAGAGNDTIYNKANTSTLDGGDGNDFLFGTQTKSSISGGAGTDTFSLIGGSGNTVVGGVGNDTIYLDSKTKTNVIQYAKGDGNDSIVGYQTTDTINITGGAYRTENDTVNGNVIVHVTSGASSTVSSGAITLEGALGKTLNIQGTRVNETATPQNVIQKFMYALDNTTQSGIAAVNYAVNIATGGYFKTAAEVINAMVKDRKSAGDADTFLKNYCGIVLNHNFFKQNNRWYINANDSISGNTDTGAITGSDAGGTSTPKTKESIVPESGSFSYYTSDSFTQGDVTFKLGKTYSSLTDSQKFIWSALQKWWVPNSMQLIYDSYGSNYNLVAEDYGLLSSMPQMQSNNNTITVNFVSSNSNYLALAGNSFYTSGSVKGIGYPVKIDINMKYYPNLDTTNYNGYDSTKKQTYLDRVLAHELTHSVMSGHIRYFNNLPGYIKEGMAELTHGIDDERGSDIIALADNSTNLKKALGNGTTANTANYSAGFMFLRYLAKQGSANFGNATVSSGLLAEDDSITVKNSILTADSSFKGETIDLTQYSSDVQKVDASKLSSDVMIIGNENANSIKGGAGNDTISGNSGDDTLIGGKGNDEIYGDGGTNLLKGGRGNDTLFGGGNDTMVGGRGKDVFVYDSQTVGNAIITDYSEKDKIEVNGTVEETVHSGQDVIFKFGESSLTVKNGAGKNINIEEIFGEGNFISENPTLADISQISEGADYLAENTAYTSLTAENNLLTYSDK